MNYQQNSLNRRFAPALTLRVTPSETASTKRRFKPEDHILDFKQQQQYLTNQYQQDYTLT